MFLLSKSICIDRYCKLVVYQGLKLDLSSEFSEKVFSLPGAPESPFDSTHISLFENVPYLRRFRIGTNLYITSDHLPGPSRVFVEDFQAGVGDNIHVDTMLLNGHMVVCLRVDGTKPQTRFNGEGHYPILAGYDLLGESLYVAAVRLEHIWFFACVANGASKVTYTDEMGDIHTTYEFFVLALRHDPCDFRSPYPRAHEGAMDPTGPLFWQKFWPEKDLDYYEDERLTDDRLLESVLDGLSAQNHPAYDMDIDLDYSILDGMYKNSSCESDADYTSILDRMFETGGRKGDEVNSVLGGIYENSSCESDED